MNEQQIKYRIDEILQDSRMLDKTANIYINSGLALVQLSLTTELHTLQRVLGIERTDLKQLRGE